MEARAEDRLALYGSQYMYCIFYTIYGMLSVFILVLIMHAIDRPCLGLRYIKFFNVI